MIPRVASLRHARAGRALFHAVANQLLRPAITVTPLPIFQDNYAYVVRDDANLTLHAVDPADASAVEAAVRAEAGEFLSVLTTHWHADHAGGNERLAQHFPGLEVVGPSVEDIPARTKGVQPGDTLRLGAMRARVLLAKCHTRGHVMYAVDEGEGSGEVHLFSGDTLFVGGCGRFFEGSAADMYAALFSDALRALPDTVRVWCGHEYTVANLRFAAAVEPDNQHVARKLAWAEAQRARGRCVQRPARPARDDLTTHPSARPTVPSTLGDERLTNPFLRVHEPAVRRAVSAEDPVSVMAKLRDWKNRV